MIRSAPRNSHNTSFHELFSTVRYPRPSLINTNLPSPSPLAPYMYIDMPAIRMWASPLTTFSNSVGILGGMGPPLPFVHNICGNLTAPNHVQGSNPTVGEAQRNLASIPNSPSDRLRVSSEEEDPTRS